MEFKIDRVMWAAGFPNAGIDAADAHKAVEAIRAKHGGNCTDADVVEAAKVKRHTLHKLFEWDDSKAAHAHRLAQARAVLRSLRVVYVGSDSKADARAYEVIERKKPTPERPARTLYSSHEEAVRDPASREHLLAEAVKQLMAWRRRFRHLNELDRVLEVVDAELERIVLDGAGQG